MPGYAGLPAAPKLFARVGIFSLSLSLSAFGSYHIIYMAERVNLPPWRPFDAVISTQTDGLYNVCTLNSYVCVYDRMYV